MLLFEKEALQIVFPGNNDFNVPVTSDALIYIVDFPLFAYPTCSEHAS